MSIQSYLLCPLIYPSTYLKTDRDTSSGAAKNVQSTKHTSKHTYLKLPNYCTIAKENSDGAIAQAVDEPVHVCVCVHTRAFIVLDLATDTAV